MVSGWALRTSGAFDSAAAAPDHANPSGVALAHIHYQTGLKIPNRLIQKRACGAVNPARCTGDDDGGMQGTALAQYLPTLQNNPPAVPVYSGGAGYAGGCAACKVGGGADGYRPRLGYGRAAGKLQGGLEFVGGAGGAVLGDQRLEAGYAYAEQNGQHRDGHHQLDQREPRLQGRFGSHLA